MASSNSSPSTNSDRGAIATFFAILLPVLLATGVLIVDVVHLRNVQDNLRGSLENSASVASSAYAAYLSSTDSKVRRNAASASQTVALNSMLAQGWPDFPARGVTDSRANGTGNNCPSITVTYTTPEIPTILASALTSSPLTVSEEVTAIYHEYANGTDCVTNGSIQPTPAPAGTFGNGRIEVLGLS
jgi:Flp pilus assembly protein TadG